MRCIHLVWTKYYVTDGLGVKMHGLPLVYIYIYVHDNCSALLSVALSHYIVPSVASFSKVLRRNTMNLTTHGSCLVHYVRLFLLTDFGVNAASPLHPYA